MRHGLNSVGLCLTAIAVFSSLGYPARAQTSVGYGQNTPLVPVAPGQLITLFVDRDGAELSGRQTAQSFPLPDQIAGFGGFGNFFPNIVERLPVYAVEVTEENKIAVTVQVPFYDDRWYPESIGVVRPESDYLCSPLGRCEWPQAIAPVRSAIHILTTCDSVLGPLSGNCSPLVTRVNGRLVGFENQPRAGETITVWAVGLGRPPVLDESQPFNEFNDVVASQADCHTVYRRPPTADAPPVEFAALLQPSVGLYQINVTIAPTERPECGPKVTIGRVIDGVVDSFDAFDLPPLVQ